MARFSFIIAMLLAGGASACREHTVVADEHLMGTVGDSGVSTELETESGAVEQGSDSEVDAGMDAGLDTDTEKETETDTETDTGTETETDTGDGCGVPYPFSWRSSGPVVNPGPEMVGIKDPTAVYYDGQWLVYATMKLENTFRIISLSFPDWESAGDAPLTLMANEFINGYKAAPQLFFYSPENTWYLLYQTPEPTYSTSKTPLDATSWSAPTAFMPIPAEFEGLDEGPIDYWIICDDTDCYLFFTAFNGHLYRAQTPKSLFPDGFEGTYQSVLWNDRTALFEASSVYKIVGEDKYLLLVGAFGDQGRRYYRSWTSDRLDGEWTALADSESDPFASIANVDNLDWAGGSVIHGEMIRADSDERMLIDTCDLQFLFSGLLPYGETDPPEPFALGLLTDARR